MISFLLTLFAVAVFEIVKELIKKNRDIKYLNFKINVLTRLLMSKEFALIKEMDEDFHSADDADLMTVISERRGKEINAIKSKLVDACVEELANTSEDENKITIESIGRNSLEHSYPFYQLYDYSEIVKKYTEKYGSILKSRKRRNSKNRAN